MEKNPAIWKANLEMYLPPPEKCKTKTHFKALTLQELRDNIRFSNEKSVYWLQVPFIRNLNCY